MKKIILLLTLALISGTSLAQGMPHHRDDHRPHHHSIQCDHKHYFVSPEQVDAIVAYLKSLSFDSDRLKAAKVFVQVTPLRADDLINIMDLFSFDDKKVELLKVAWDYTLDEEHFEIAVRHLTFRSNQDKVYKYMGRP